MQAVTDLHDLRRGGLIVGQTKDGSCHMADYLSAGSYQAITHDAVVRRLNQDAQIRICSVRPVFSDTLHSILLAQTCRRCRRCAKRCAAWRQAERPFYLVKFEKFDLKGEKKK